MAAVAALFPWDKTNPQEQEIIRICNDQSINKLLVQKTPNLRQIIDPSVLWPHLRSLCVLVPSELERIKLNATPHEQVERLLEHLERGPTWRFYSLLRACALTGQEHVIRDLGFDPGVYMLEEEHHTGTFESSNDETGSVSLSGQLLRAIQDHCRACQQRLMRTNLFDFNSNPNAEVLDLAEYFVQVELRTKQKTRFHKDLVTIPEDLILRSFNGQPSPQAARLEGAPGAGKTTSLKHIVYEWSKEFTKLPGDHLTLNTENGLFSTMVYLHVRSIKGSVREAIRNALWCRQEDKDVLMDHVELGEGVAVVIDAIDELRNEAVIKELQVYMDKHTGGRQKILVSSRTGLCCISQRTFDRVLVLQGFSLAQALEYAKGYFPPSGSTPHQVLTYMEQHQQELKPILTNPLMLHMLCELTCRGLLELKPGVSLDVHTLFRQLEKFLIERELDKRHKEGGGDHQVTPEDKEQFYRLCLYGMLLGISAFTQKHMDQFKINKVYQDTFLIQDFELGECGTYERYYRFAHQMMYEYFAAAYIQTASAEMLKPLLLLICSQDSLRNLQKMICEILSRSETDRENLLQGTIRSILILQLNKETSPTKNYYLPLTEMLRSMKFFINFDNCIEQLMMSQEDKNQVFNAHTIWDAINRVFDYHSHELKDEAMYADMDDNHIKHMVECIQSCPQEHQEQLFQHTMHHLFPCIYRDEEFEFFYSVYAAGPSQWGTVKHYDGEVMGVDACCPLDMLKVLQAFQLAHSQHTWLFSVFINISNYQWGVRPDCCWSQHAWTSLLHLVPCDKKIRELTIYMDDMFPLGGLMSSLTLMELPGDRHIEVNSGTATMEEVEVWVDKWEVPGKVFLSEPYIVLPSGVSEVSLRARVEKLLKATDDQGRKLVDHPIWRTETGEKHTLPADLTPTDITRPYDFYHLSESSEKQFDVFPTSGEDK